MKRIGVRKQLLGGLGRVWVLFLAIPLGAADNGDLERSVKRLTEVLAVLEQRLAEPFTATEAFYRGAIPSMVRTLDPHSAFLDPQQFESLQEMQRSTEKGFGSVVSLSPGRVTVLQTLPESPSARAGMAPGDEIVALNGYPLANLSVDQLVGLLTQSKQQRVELMVQRPNFPRLIPMTLTPEELADPNVQHPFFLQPGYAYVRIASFESQTDAEFGLAIRELGEDKIEGLVLDLRNNPGGVVEAAVRTAAMFLEPGQRILWIRGREGPQEEVRAPPGRTPYRFPVAILIDERTASAAELVTGALQDHDRATVVGAGRSFGKGLVQSVFPLSDETGLALTTALYLTPSGRPVQRPWGDCSEYQLAACEGDDDEQRAYPTDAGREIPGGGGIEPDLIAYPRPLSRFETYLALNGAFLDFAREWVRENTPEREFQVTPRLLDDFQRYLAERGARPPLSEWTAATAFIRQRLEQEILTLAYGVDAGEEVELRADAQVKAALRALEKR